MPDRLEAMKNKWLQGALSVLSLGLAVLLVIYLPQIVQTLTGKPVSWSEIGAVFGGLGAGTIAGMAALWLLSLLAYTFVLTGSLPGLNNLQALTLNAAGSAVSNLLPFGGAAGVALTFAMTRGWGFANRPIVVMTLVSGIWNTLFRFILPAVGIIGLLMAGQVPDRTVANAGWVGAVSILGLCALVAAALYWDRAANALGAGLDFLMRLVRLKVRPSAAFHRLRSDTAEIVRTRWGRLSLGMAGFLGSSGRSWPPAWSPPAPTRGWRSRSPSSPCPGCSPPPWSRPAARGSWRPGVVSCSPAPSAWRAAPATATALLFGFWTYTVEIPFGGLALGAWALLRRRNGRGAAATPSSTISKAPQ